MVTNTPLNLQRSRILFKYYYLSPAWSNHYIKLVSKLSTDLVTQKSWREKIELITIWDSQVNFLNIVLVPYKLNITCEKSETNLMHNLLLDYNRTTVLLSLCYHHINLRFCNFTLLLYLTHFRPMFLFYTPTPSRKSQETRSFLCFVRGIEGEHWTKMVQEKVFVFHNHN